MRLIDFGLSEDQVRQLVRGVAEAQYNLLLGAGFAMSARDSEGKNLPSGPGLAKELNSQFSLNVPVAQENNLSLVFEEAKNYGKDENPLIAFLKKRFLRVNPSWHEVVLEMPWERIWTLNIDDMFDVMRAKGRSAYRPVPVSWVDDLSSLSISSSSVQVVHLHGRVSAMDSSTDNLIFTLKQYAKATRQKGDWHSEFRGQWLQRPFLVIGARLVEEFDIVETLTQGTLAENSTGFPTIAVIKGLEEIDARRLKRGNVIPIDSSGEDFFLALTEELRIYHEMNAEVSRSVLPHGTIARFNQQFEIIANGRADLVRANHDFYGGDEPIWSDINQNLDAPRQVLNSGLSEFMRVAKAGNSAVVLLTGTAGAGRTTSLLRLGQRMVANGFQVFKFRGLERPDVDSAVSWVRANGHVFLIFDNAADFAGSIREIAANAKAVGARVLIAASERSRRASILEEDLRTFLVANIEMSEVSRPDALAIVAKRRNFARMGVATGWDENKLWKYFKKDNRGDLFMALSGLEQGNGFYSRLDREWNSIATIASSSQLKILYAIALVHRLGYSLPVKVAIDLSSRSEISQVDFSSSPFADVLINDARGFRYRHRMLAEYVFRRHVPLEARYEISLSCVQSLAPLVSPGTMSQRTYPVLILRQLMDKDSVVASAGTVQKARSWYESLRNDFAWNGRYWDQRALLESDAGAHDRAYSYAMQSIAVHRHAFSLNTLGRVRLKAAVDNSFNLDECWVFFKEGAAALLESVAHARSHGDYYEHPAVTIFSYIAEFVNRLPSGDLRIVDLDQIRLDWEREVRQRSQRSMLVETKMREAREKMLRASIK